MVTPADNGHSLLYGLIGKKLGHSASARLFNEKFRNENIDARYELIELPDIALLREYVGNHPDLAGLNVTIPYKQSVIPHLDMLSPEAAAIGAVNVIRIIREPTRLLLEGHNSDCIGFAEALSAAGGPVGNKALIAGNGGAAAAVGVALRKMGLDTVVASRNPHGEGMVGYDSIDEALMAECLTVVNATPLGMWPDTQSAPPLPYHLIGRDHLCFDLVYNPPVTEFMRLCARQGARVANGMEMLIRQARAAWQIWNSWPQNQSAEE